jgi:hypothetical protein
LSVAPLNETASRRGDLKREVAASTRAQILSK